MASTHEWLALARVGLAAVPVLCAVVPGALLLGAGMAPIIPFSILVALAGIPRLLRVEGVLSLGLAPGPVASALVLASELAPWVALVVRLRIDRATERGLLDRMDAARDLGASPARALLWVALPEVRGALAAAGVLSVVQVLGDTVASRGAGGGLWLSPGAFLVQLVDEGGAPGRSAAWASAVGLLVPSVVAAVVLDRALPRVGRSPARSARRYGRPRLPRAFALPGLGLSAVVPVAAAWRAPLVAWGRADALWVDALVPTLQVAAVVVPLGLGFGMIGARSRSTTARSFALFGLAAPPVTLGFLALELGRLVGAPPGLPLVVPALLPLTAAVTTVLARGGALAVPAALVDAARSLGADGAARARYLAWPLLGRSTVVAAALLFAVVAAEASAASLTSAPGFATTAVVVAILSRSGETGALLHFVFGLVMLVALVAGSVGSRVSREAS